MALFSLLDLSHAFGGAPVLDHVNFQVDPGERVCLVGRNGAGKSTLMKLIAGDMKPDTGQVFRQPGAHFARLVQEVPQDLKGNVHDLVASGLAEAGLVLDFWKIAMRPGKPLMHGRLGALPLIGLPGNPVSALICALLFVGPALDRLSGLPGDPPRRAHARLGRDLPANDHRADHLRATLSVDDQGALVVTPAPRQDSGMLRTLARADAVILRAPHAKAAYIGDQVEILQMDGLG